MITILIEPYIKDPIEFFRTRFGGNRSNYYQALKVYNSQCRKNEDIKAGVRSEFSKLIDKGFICKLDELPDCHRKLIAESPINHFYPWRSVFKPDSLSTPVRIVADPSMSGMNLTISLLKASRILLIS